MVLPSQHSYRELPLKEFASRGFRDSVKRSEHDKHRETERSQWKRGVAKRIDSGTLDPWYGCDIFDEMWDYAFNFTYPWSMYPIRHYSMCTC